MQNTSTTYDTIWSGSAPHNVELKVVINGVEYQQSQILSLRTTRSLFDEGVPKVGSATSSELDLTIIKPSATIPAKAIVVPWFRIKNAESQSEWLPVGKYYIDTRESTNYNGSYNTLTLHCYDSMLKLDISASSTFTAGSTNIQTILQFVSLYFAITSVDESISSLLSTWVATAGTYPVLQITSGKTVRDVLKEVGSLLGCNFMVKVKRVLVDGVYVAKDYLACHKLGTIPVSEESFLIDEGNNILTFGDTNILLSAGSTQSLGQSMMDYNEAPQFLPFGRAVINALNGSYEKVTQGQSSLTHRTLTVDLECFNASNSIANALYNSIVDYAYQPYTAINAVLNPASELGDVITANGKTSIVAVIETDWDSLSLATVSAPCDEEINHEYQYEDPVERAVDSKVTLGQSYNGTTISSSGITAQGNGFVLKDGDGNNAIVYNSTTRKFTFNGSIEIADGSISFAKLDSTNQTKVNFGINLANGDAAGGSFISATSIYSPTIFSPAIYANVLQLRPRNGMAGKFSFVATFGSADHEVFTIDYYAGNQPNVFLGSPDNANIYIGMTNMGSINPIYFAYEGNTYRLKVQNGYVIADLNG